MPYRWDDEYGARLGVLRRDDPFGEIVGSRSTRVTSSTSPTPTIATANLLCCKQFDTRNCGATTAASRPTACCGAGPSIWRPGASSERQLDDRGVEFPRIDDRLAGLPARYVVAVGDGNVIQYDFATGCATGTSVWRRPGEAVFVPRIGHRRNQRVVSWLRL